jgi:hypothetical protein
MLSEVTSLFDLLNRAKKREPYRTLVLITAKSLSSRATTFDGAAKYLELLAQTEGNCQLVTNEANYQLQFIKDDVEPSVKPPPKADEKSYEQLQAEFESIKAEALKSGIPRIISQQMRNIPRRSWPVPGDMTEYGWYDPEIEDDIERVMDEAMCNREEALLRVFNHDRERI